MHIPIPRGGAQLAPILEPPCPTYVRTVRHTAVTFSMVIKVVERKSFYSVGHAHGPGQKMCVTQMLTRDLFAVSNLFVTT